MQILFFYRNKKAGFSIHKVFNTITAGFNNKEDIISKFEMPVYGASIKNVFNNIRFIYKNRTKKGINHITGDIHYGILGLIGCKSVLTVHDLVLLENTRNKLKKFILFIFWYYLPIKMATKVVCISEKTKSSVLKYVKRKDIDVVYNPLDDFFKFEFKEFNKKNPVVLHIGTGWNKNLSAVIKALKGIKCVLRIIGKINEKDLLLLERYKIDYSNGYKLTDKEILEEYVKSDIVSFPSIFEGFGMPVIEGQAIGRVVLTSNITPMTEISGSAVYYVDPNSVESVRNGFLDIINNDKMRLNLIDLGIINVKKFDVSEIVKKYRLIYKKISNDKS